MSKQTQTTEAAAPEVNVTAIQEAVMKRSHPAANLFPMMSADEFENLVMSMGANGFDPRKPIKLKGEQITDGRNRAAGALVWNARAEIWNADPKNTEKKPLVQPVYVQEENTNDAAIFGDVMTDNFARRNMTQSQKAAVLVKAGILAGVYKKKEELGAIGKKVAGDVAELVAKQHGLNADYLYKTKAVAKSKNGKELLNAIARGEKSVMEAYKSIQEVPAGDPAQNDDPADVFDGTKKAVPQEFRGVFAVREKFGALAKLLREARKLSEEIAAHEGGVLFNEGNNLKEAKAALSACAKIARNCEPHTVCPHCEGEGHTGEDKEPCPVCAGVGFVTEPQAENFEKFGVPKPTEAAEAPAPAAKPAKVKPAKPAEAPAPEGEATGGEPPAEAPAPEGEATGGEPAPV